MKSYFFSFFSMVLIACNYSEVKQNKASVDTVTTENKSVISDKIKLLHGVWMHDGESVFLIEGDSLVDIYLGYSYKIKVKGENMNGFFDYVLIDQGEPPYNRSLSLIDSNSFTFKFDSSDADPLVLVRSDL